MNCLTYLLLLWEQNHRFKIFYNGDHCYGVNEKKLFDLDGGFKKDMLNGYADMYSEIKNWHSKEVIKKIFNLNERFSKIIDEYYEGYRQME